MWVFIVCVCLGVILTFIFVAKFLYNHYCKKSKSTQTCTTGPVTVVVPSSFTNGGTGDLQSYVSFIPGTCTSNAQPYVMVGDLSNGINGPASSCGIFGSADDDILGQLDSTDSTEKLIEPPPSYEDLFPLSSRRNLDTITEE
ncbi:UNVERIFIED_CONTAM: hypothetical protein RMT77_008251 [Armadillidium vulgare]